MTIPNNSSAVFIDAEKRQIVCFTDDMLLNQLRRDGPKIEASFDALCEDDLRQLSHLYSQASGLLLLGFRIGLRQENKLDASCAQLLANAAKSLSSAVAVLRMGYLLQPGIIIRSMLEAMSTVLHLLQNPEDFKAYENHTLQSNKTIAAAKKALPPYGYLYGFFSDNFAHIGALHKSLTPLSEFKERHEALQLNLSFLRIASWLLYVTTELLFNELVESPRYWHAVGEGGYAYNPSDGERAWMAGFLKVDE